MAIENSFECGASPQLMANPETAPLMFEMKDSNGTTAANEPLVTTSDRRDFDLEMSLDDVAICQGSCLSDPQVN